MPKPLKDRFKLDKVDTCAPSSFNKKNTKDKKQSIHDELDKLQNLLYADKKHALLVIVQGMDASGKDGLMKMSLVD